MRSFICIDLPKKIREEIIKIQHQINPGSFRGKFIEPENLHLTLKFLGEIDADTITNVKKRLQRIAWQEQILTLGELGTFDYQEQPRIIWMKIDGADELQKSIDNALASLFSKEARFMSHLTIARIKEVLNKSALERNLKKIKITPRTFSCTSFFLKESTLRRQGPRYRTLAEYRTRL